MKEVSKAKLSSLTQDPGGGAQYQPQQLNSSLQRMRDSKMERWTGSQHNQIWLLFGYSASLRVWRIL